MKVNSTDPFGPCELWYLRDKLDTFLRCLSLSFYWFGRCVRYSDEIANGYMRLSLYSFSELYDEAKLIE